MVSNIEIERVKLELTKGQMAAELGVSDKTYHKYVHGGSIPSSVILKLVGMTGKTAGYLLNLEPA